MAESSESVAKSVPDAKFSLPSELFRTIVSLLLFVHLFSVGLGIISSPDVGTSTLLARIKANTPLIEPYLWQLWLDHGYDYRLIGFMPMLDETASYDWDNYLEATLRYADGHEKVLELPEEGVWPSDRRHRLQQMAKFMAMNSKMQDGPDPEEYQNNNRHLVGGSIGAALLRENPDATSVVLRWYYHRGLTGAEVRGPEPPVWTSTDPRFFVTVSRMIVTLVEDQPQSMDILPLGEVSPLKHESGNGKASGPSSASDSGAAVSPGAKSSQVKAPANDGAAKDSSTLKSKAESN